MKLSTTQGSYTTLWLLIFLIFGIGWADSLVTLPEIKNWYAQLNKPSFNPPNYLFGPVWSVIYLFIAISQWMVWDVKYNRQIKVWFGLMIICNALWSPIFFKYHKIGWGLVILSLYLITLGAWVRTLYLENKKSAYLQCLHIIWVSFASLLNTSIYLLNR
jgi:tryptophan-rich sensory protein